MNWRIWQLADSAFPTGGFAHSGGLEAALQQGEIQNLDEFKTFITAALWQAGFGGLPLLNSAHSSLDSISELDQLCDVFITNHVANRASRVQGRSFFSACLRSFSFGQLVGLDELMKEQGLFRHYAPVFGGVLSILEIDLRSSQMLFLYCQLRGLLSASVRLGITGPYQSQKIQFEFANELEKIVQHCGRLKSDELSQSAPLLDLFQANHDRLYSRLFQS